ncbi:MAG: hypothetical protein AAGL98_02315 [Planctomycetota bacterium]
MLNFTRLSVWLILFSAAPAVLAQPVADAKGGNAWVAFVVAIFLVILVVAGALMSPRRGHLD